MWSMRDHSCTAQRPSMYVLTSICRRIVPRQKSAQLHAHLLRQLADCYIEAVLHLVQRLRVLSRRHKCDRQALGAEATRTRHLHRDTKKIFTKSAPSFFLTQSSKPWCKKITLLPTSRLPMRYELSVHRGSVAARIGCQSSTVK